MLPDMQAETEQEFLQELPVIGYQVFGIPTSELPIMKAGLPALAFGTIQIGEFNVTQEVQLRETAVLELTELIALQQEQIHLHFQPT